jgi:AraC-like DNA-binding protein
MNGFFLPKDFNAEKDYCSQYQYGKNRTHPHWHSGAEIIYVTTGEVDVLFGDCWHTLKKGSLIFIPPKRFHCSNCSDSSAEKIVLGFSENLFGKSESVLSLSNEVDAFCVIDNSEGADIGRLIESFHEYCLKNSDCASDLMARSQIIEIYARVIEYWKQKGINPIGEPKSKLLTSVQKYVEENYKNELSASKVARHFNVSYSALAEVMRELRCGGFIKYLNRVRIDNSKKLLATTDKSITEIGFECGFSVTSYFIKTFNGFTGMTPKQYRKFLAYMDKY